MHMFCFVNIFLFSDLASLSVKKLQQDKIISNSLLSKEFLFCASDPNCYDTTQCAAHSLLLRLTQIPPVSLFPVSLCACSTFVDMPLN